MAVDSANRTMAKPSVVTQKKKSNRIIIWFLFLIVVGLSYYCYQRLYKPSVTRSVAFTVKPGSGLKQVVASLEEKELIPDAFMLSSYARIRKLDRQLKAGTFLIKAGQNPVEVLDSLVSGQAVLERVTFPEGYTLKQIANRLAKEAPPIEPFIELIKTSRLPENVINEFVNNPPLSSEGYLFPDTYYYSLDKAEEVYHSMYSQMVKVLEELYTTFPENPIALGRLTLHQAVTLASVVEKEAMLDSERPLIAGVFLRRLDRGMNLQSCATVTYVLEKPVAKLTYKDLEIDSPYNTYRYPGLPVGPVSNPGRKSLEAVFNPQLSEYLFFVAKGDGSHIFTRTYSEHLTVQRTNGIVLSQNSKE